MQPTTMPDPFNNLKQHIEMSPELESAFMHIISERTYQRGQTISGIGDLRHHLFYIKSGSARVYFLSGGKEHTYSFAFENEYIPLSYPLVSNSNYETSIEFLETTTVSIIPHEQLHSLLHEYDLDTSGNIIKEIFTGIIRQLTSFEERLLVMQTCSASERYNWLVNRYPKILERAKITQIASFLGVTKETLYRIRSGKY